VGKKNLEKALELAKPREGAKNVVFTTTWRPFFLMPPQVWTRGIASGQFPPDAETKGIEKLPYYISKFGANALPPMLERLGGAMRDSGIENFSMGGNTGPTLDGHRLATYAEKEGLDKQNAFMEEIFRAYFCEEKAPCDRAVLEKVAKDAGLDETRTREILDAPTAELGDVDEQLKRYARGVGGVPHFIVSDGKRRVAMSGAQPPEQFLEVFEDFGVDVE
jgi:predicted DsbA family dithiol-disulfide isomerase